MRDRVVEHPNRYKLTPVSGDIYDLTPEPGIVTEQGTPLNKATLLSDQTAEALGMEQANPTVDDALGVTIPAKFSNIIFGYNPRKHSQTILTSQNWTVPPGVTEVDVWLVGGGGGGYHRRITSPNGGGGGGHCAMFRGIAVTPGGIIAVVIGAGGAPGDPAMSGGDTTFGECCVLGGQGGFLTRGGAGGSGGGGGGAGTGSPSQGGNGGAGGTNGWAGQLVSNVHAGGIGDGLLSTINPYTVVLYAGGGGGAGMTVRGLGGAGGGGNGYNSESNPSTPGVDGLGGGGGGGNSTTFPGSKGGSGVCIIYYD